MLETITLTVEQKDVISKRQKISIKLIDELWEMEDENFLAHILVNNIVDYDTSLVILKTIFRNTANKQIVELYMYSVDDVNFLYHVFVEENYTQLADIAAKLICKAAMYKGLKFRLNDPELEDVAKYTVERLKREQTHLNYRTTEDYTEAFKAMKSIKKYVDYPDDWIEALL